MGVFIGIDLASSTVGLCVLSVDGDLNHLSRKATSPANFTSKWDRYAVVVGHVLDVVLPIKSHIDRIFIEGYGGAFKNSLIPAVECGTIMRMSLIKAGLLPKVTEVAPMSLKKFITGSGNAKKENMIAYIFKNYGFMAPDNDQADAYALAQMARKSSWAPEQRETLYVYEKEALKGIKL